ncbi:MAG: hypothetical protein WBA68_08915 [Alteraurantiacibacter sp.]
MAATAGASQASTRANYLPSATSFDLTISPAQAEMIDGQMLYQLLFFQGANDPSPELRVQQGRWITINVTNADSRPHQFYILGVPKSFIPTIEPGQTGTAVFRSPRGGTYLYVDPLMDPVNRLLGLHGAFVSEPLRNGKTPNGNPTPYSDRDHNPQLHALFDAFGRTSRFPGDRWRHSDSDREKTWLFTQIDPSLNASVAAGDTVDPERVRDAFLPRYFTINGLSGFDTAVHGDGSHADPRAMRIMPRARQGQPCLLRCLNAGLAHHAVHIHGNHCMEVAESDSGHRMMVNSNIYERDTWHLHPLQRVDMMLPFERPPDIPDQCWPPREETFPLRYVMHCHFELSQTAGGGNYPQGAVTHWEMTAPL